MAYPIQELKGSRIVLLPRMNHCLLPLTTALLLLLAANTHALTLAEAEQIALKNDPLLAQFQAQRDSLAEQSVAAYSWPDPQISLGVVDFPLDEFNFEKDDATQGVVGLVQMFPPMGSVAAKRDEMRANSVAMEYNNSDRKLATLRDVRVSWFSVYQWLHSKRLVEESIDVFGQLKKITRLQYQSGRGKQFEVIQAQLEESLLLDKAREIEENLDIAIAALKLNLNVARLDSDLDGVYPELPEVPGSDELATKLETHPWLKVGEQRVNAAQNGVEFADAQFNPSWSFDISYGYRGTGYGGVDRGDMVSAMLLLDLPLFTGNRQSRLYKSSQLELTAARFTLEDLKRQLRRQLDENLALYLRSDERIQIYEKQLLPQAEQNTQASLNAYQSGVDSFSGLVRARLTELDSRLQHLGLKVKRAKAQAELLYLAGAQQ